MSKKVFASIGMVVCVVFIVMGFATMGKDNSCSTSSRSGLYDSGLATFGTDFYTYSNNNAAEAASAARTTANNIRELYGLLTDMFGWLFVFVGAIGLCHFGIICAESCAPKGVSVFTAKETFQADGELNIIAETENETPQAI